MLCNDQLFWISVSMNGLENWYNSYYLWRKHGLAVLLCAKWLATPLLWSVWNRLAKKALCYAQGIWFVFERSLVFKDGFVEPKPVSFTIVVPGLIVCCKAFRDEFRNNTGMHVRQYSLSELITFICEKAGKGLSNHWLNTELGTANNSEEMFCIGRQTASEQKICE